MDEIVKEDNKTLFTEFKSRRGTRLNSEALAKVEAGEYFSGNEAVKAGLADQLGTIQKVILREFPDAYLYYVPLGNKRYLDRRYLGRSVKTGTKV
jgi:ClpP class serine protease